MRYLNFSGILPKIKPQALGDTHGQVAHNLDIIGNLLRGFRAPAPTEVLRNDDGSLFSGHAETLYKAGNVWVAWDTTVSVASDVQGDPGFDSFLFAKAGKLHWQSAQRIIDGLAPVVVGICRPTTTPTAVVMVGMGCAETAPQMPCVDGTGGVACETGQVTQLRDYVFTYVKHYPGCVGRFEESAPSTPTYAEVLDGDAVALSIGAPALPSGATSVRWYRAIAGTDGSIIRLFVGESASTAFIDGLCAADLGEPLDTYRHYAPPECVDGVATVGDAVVVLWHGKNMWVSHPRLAHAYDPERGTFPLLYDIVGMRSAVGRMELATTYNLHVLTTGKPYVVSGIDTDKIDIREAQFWHPCVSARSICDMGDRTGYASPYGFVAFSGEGVVSHTDNWLSEDEWQRERPEDMRACYWHERVWMLWSDKNGIVLTVASETGMRRKAVVTHSIKGRAWYARADVVLHMSPERSTTTVYEWGRGLPLKWRWRGPEEVQNGLWRPAAAKVMSAATRHRTDIVQAQVQFDQWTAAHMHTVDSSLFFSEHPELQHLYAQLVPAQGHNVTVYSGGKVFYNRHVTSVREFRLPRKTRDLEWSVEVEGYDDVREVHMQTSINDLVQNGGSA